LSAAEFLRASDGALRGKGFELLQDGYGCRTWFWDLLLPVRANEQVFNIVASSFPFRPPHMSLPGAPSLQASSVRHGTSFISSPRSTHYSRTGVYPPPSLPSWALWFASGAA